MDNGYAVGYLDDGEFVEVGRFNNLDAVANSDLEIRHADSETRVVLGDSGFDFDGSDVAGIGSLQAASATVDTVDATDATITNEPQEPESVARKTEIDGLDQDIDGVQSNLDGHVGDTDNPHLTTLEEARVESNTLSGPVDHGGNDINSVGTASVGALEAEKIPVVNNTIFVEPSDDLAFVLDDADSGSTIYLLPGDHNISSFVSIPPNSLLTGSNNARIISDGGRISVSTESTMSNIRVLATDVSDRAVLANASDTVVADCIIDVRDSSGRGYQAFSNGAARLKLLSNTIIQNDGGSSVRFASSSDIVVEGNVTTGISVDSTVSNIAVGDANITIEGGEIL